MVFIKILKKIYRSIFRRKASPKKAFNNRFIKVNDTIADKSFQLFLREDSFMEKVILEKGIYGEWEKESLKIWSFLSKHSKVIIDIGANTGIYSMLAQNNNPKAKIIAIEPVKINFEVLSKNIRQNKFSIIAEKVALSDKQGTAKMYMLKDRLNYMTSVNDDRYENAPHVKLNYEVVEIEVPIKPFSFIFKKNQLDRIDLIKIDVEGHEITVLNGMLSYIGKYRPVLLIEIIGDENAIAINEMFKSLDYKFVSIDEVNTSTIVEKLWDNNHHNFLLCHKETISILQQNKLVE